MCCCCFHIPESSTTQPCILKNINTKRYVHAYLRNLWGMHVLFLFCVLYIQISCQLTKDTYTATGVLTRVCTILKQRDVLFVCLCHLVCSAPYDITYVQPPKFCFCCASQSTSLISRLSTKKMESLGD